MKNQNKRKLTSIIGEKPGSYLTLKVISNTDRYNGYGRLICKAGETYYYHLQYPTLGECKAHVSMLLYMGNRVTAITTTQSTADKDYLDFALPCYLTNYQIDNNVYWRVCHYNTYRHLGLI